VGSPSNASPAQARRAGAGLLLGARLFGRGVGMYLRNPRYLFLGTIPAIIALVLVAVAFAVLVYFVDDLSALVTWFADDWSAGPRRTIRVLAGAAILVSAALVTVLTYTALTLLIGDPFYEVISQRVEERLGGGTQGTAGVPWFTSFRRNAADSIRMILLSVSVSVPLFLIGFVPVFGQVVVPVLEAVIGGWFLAVELTGVPFNRRGLRLADRRRILRGNRALALGFGIPVFLLLLVPFAAILVVPAAVVGSTLLTRQVLGQSIEAR
jgi:CysZ protein